MDIVAGLGSKAVFDGPYLFQKGVRDYGFKSVDDAMEPAGMHDNFVGAGGGGFPKPQQRADHLAVATIFGLHARQGALPKRWRHPGSTRMEDRSLRSGPAAPTEQWQPGWAVDACSPMSGHGKPVAEVLAPRHVTNAAILSMKSPICIPYSGEPSFVSSPCAIAWRLSIELDKTGKALAAPLNFMCTKGFLRV
jgi:hypothetical protein